MKHKRLYLIGAILLLAFAGFSLASFNKALTPYVSFEQARSAGRTVQIAAPEAAPTLEQHRP